MTKEILRQQGEQIKDESVKAEWKAVIAASSKSSIEAKVQPLCIRL